MRKSVIVAALLLLGGTALRAQEGRHEVNLFLGGYKTEFIQDKDIHDYGDMLFDSGNNLHTGDLCDIYEPHYSYKSSPVVTVTYHYLLKDWLRVGAQTNWGLVAGRVWYEMGNRPTQNFKQSTLSLLPEVKLCVPGRRHFRLYAKAAAGLQLNLGQRMAGAGPVGFAWDVVPIGAEWGGFRFYGNAEVSLGSVLRGGRIGIGYRF